MTISRSLFFIKLLIICTGVITVSFSNADRYQRPMQIHKIKRIGLEIWTESEPEWSTELVINKKKPIFVAHTPYLTYPPSGMTWTNHSEVIVSKGEFSDIAKSTLETAAKNYGLSNSEIEKLNIMTASYGIFSGYEVNFISKLKDKSIDVKVFTGRSDNRGPVTMQVYTTEGKLKHLSEQIRRSWTNTKYLN